MVLVSPRCYESFSGGYERTGSIINAGAVSIEIMSLSAPCRPRGGLLISILPVAPADTNSEYWLALRHAFRCGGHAPRDGSRSAQCPAGARYRGAARYGLHPAPLSAVPPLRLLPVTALTSGPDVTSSGTDHFHLFFSTR